MSYWNYRVICKAQNNEYEPYFFEVHEVYYNDNDEIESWTEDPVCPGGGDLVELREDFEHFAQALRQPVLNLEDLEAMAVAAEEEERRQFQLRYGHLTPEDLCAALDAEIEGLCPHTGLGLHCDLVVGHPGNHICSDPKVMLRNQMALGYYPLSIWEPELDDENEDTCKQPCDCEESEGRNERPSDHGEV